MTRSTADALLQELGARMGIPGLRLDDAGCCQLAFDQQWLVTLVWVPQRERLVLHCPIAAPSVTAGLPAATLQAMLQANFLGRGAGAGGLLAVGTDQRACVQWELPLPGAEPAALYNGLEALLHTAERWAQRLQQAPTGGPRERGGAPAWMGQRV